MKVGPRRSPLFGRGPRSRGASQTFGQQASHGGLPADPVETMKPSLLRPIRLASIRKRRGRLDPSAILAKTSSPPDKTRRASCPRGFSSARILISADWAYTWGHLITSHQLAIRRTFKSQQIIKQTPGVAG